MTQKKWPQSWNPSWYRYLIISLCAFLAHSTTYAHGLDRSNICALSDGKYPYALSIPWRNKSSTESGTGIIKKAQNIYAVEGTNILRMSCEDPTIERVHLDKEWLKIIEIQAEYLILKSNQWWDVVNIRDNSVRSILLSEIQNDIRVVKYKSHYSMSLRITRVTKEWFYIQVMRTNSAQYEYGKKSFFFSKENTK